MLFPVPLGVAGTDAHAYMCDGSPVASMLGPVAVSLTRLVSGARERMSTHRDLRSCGAFVVQCCSAGCEVRHPPVLSLLAACEENPNTRSKRRYVHCFLKCALFLEV